MVTQTIELENIRYVHLDINNWISNGITNDALLICRENWEAVNDKEWLLTKNNYIWLIRNQTNALKHINPVNKW